MTIKTMFDIGDKVYWLSCGIITATNVTSIKAEVTIHGTSVSYTLGSGHTAFRTTIFETKEEAGIQLLQNNGLLPSLKEIYDN